MSNGGFESIHTRLLEALQHGRETVALAMTGASGAPYGLRGWNACSGPACACR